MLNTKIKPNRKKRFLCLFFVFLLLAALTVPCFAWSTDPTYYDDYFYIYGPYGYYFFEWLKYGEYNQSYDFSMGRLPSDTSSLSVYTYFNGSSNILYYGDEDFDSYINHANEYYDNIYNSIYNDGYNRGEIIGTQNGIYQGQNEVYDIFSDSIAAEGGTIVGSNADIRGSIENSISTNFYDFELRGATYGYENGYGVGYDDGLEEGYDEGYGVGLSEGYSDGVAESGVFENYLLTLFTIPTYVLSTVFNFEIFGINIYLLITFLLTIAIVGIVLKKIL